MIRLDNKKQFDIQTIEDYRKIIFKEINLNQFNCIVISDYNKGIVNQEIIQKLKSFNGPIFIDTKKKDLSIWRELKKYYLKINMKEYDTAEKVWMVKNLIVTDGPNGAILEQSNIRSIKETVFFDTKEYTDNPEVTGCGDVFLSGLVVNYLKTNNLHQAIKFANIVAGLNTCHNGTTEIYYEW